MKQSSIKHLVREVVKEVLSELVTNEQLGSELSSTSTVGIGSIGSSSPTPSVEPMSSAEKTAQEKAAREKIEAELEAEKQRLDILRQKKISTEKELRYIRNKEIPKSQERVTTLQHGSVGTLTEVEGNPKMEIKPVDFWGQAHYTVFINGKEMTSAHKDLPVIHRDAAIEIGQEILDNIEDYEEYFSN
jgi:predicted methyltransferase